jgi:hypothetical protein
MEHFFLSHTVPYRYLGTGTYIIGTVLHIIKERTSVADPGSGDFLTPGSGIQYQGWVNNQDTD